MSQVICAKIGVGECRIVRERDAEITRLRAELAAARKLLKRIYACDEKWGPNGWLVDLQEYMKAEAAKEGER